MTRQRGEAQINDDQHRVPDNTIVVVTQDPQFDVSVERILQPLKGEKSRDWFLPHAYLCLPLIIGNQYGFVVRSLFAFDVTWRGGETPDNVEVEMLYSNGDEDALEDHQYVCSHFGMGTITVHNRFHFRTPPGINLMTISPPNHFIDGIEHMTGVVETDNLRRDFTFNLKLTCPGKRVHVAAGTPIGCILPVERYFVDRFRLRRASDVFSPQVVEAERAAGRQLAAEREQADLDRPHRSGRRYFRGEHAGGEKFSDHQRDVED